MTQYQIQNIASRAQYFALVTTLSITIFIAAVFKVRESTGIVFTIITPKQSNDLQLLRYANKSVTTFFILEIYAERSYFLKETNNPN